MEIKDRLVYALKTLEIGPTEAAEKTGIPYRTLYNYMKGLRKPDSDSLSRIGEHLCISINWLLTGIGDMMIDSSSLPKRSDVYISPMARKTAEMMSGWSEEDQRDFFKRVEEKYKQLDDQKKQAEELEKIKAQMAELEKLLHKSA